MNCYFCSFGSGQHPCIKLKMNPEHSRWQQRFANFNKAFNKLHEAVSRLQHEEKSDDDRHDADDSFWDDLIKEALIQRFEYTHELAWNVMKDYLFEVGNVSAIGSKDATREAFAAGLIADGDTWMEMIRSRNKTSHTYNEATADEIFEKILSRYHPAFLAFKAVMDARKS